MFTLTIPKINPQPYLATEGYVISEFFDRTFAPITKAKYTIPRILSILLKVLSRNMRSVPSLGLLAARVCESVTVRHYTKRKRLAKERAAGYSWEYETQAVFPGSGFDTPFLCGCGFVAPKEMPRLRYHISRNLTVKRQGCGSMRKQDCPPKEIWGLSE